MRQCNFANYECARTCIGGIAVHFTGRNIRPIRITLAQKNIQISAFLTQSSFTRSIPPAWRRMTTMTSNDVTSPHVFLKRFVYTALKEQKWKHFVDASIVNGKLSVF